MYCTQYASKFGKLSRGHGDWKMSVFIPIPKKGNAKECSNYRTIALISVQFSSGVSDSLRPHGLQYTRIPFPSPTPGACLNSRPLSRWCHPTISSSVIPFSYCLQSCPALGAFPVSQFFTLGGQWMGVSASASLLPMNIQDWFPLGLNGLISRVFSNATAQKHQFFGAQLSLEFNSQIHTWLLEKPQLWLDGRSSHC